MNIAAIKEKLDDLDKRLPVRETLMLPSDIFFSREIPLPEGTLPMEITGFVQLQVEAIAPFPIENLSWGYLTGKGSVLLYAATQDRAESFARNDLEDLWNVFPAFLPFALLPEPTEDTMRVCLAAGSASVLWIKAGQALPYKIQSLRMPEGTPLTTDEEILAARQDIIDALEIDGAQKMEDGVFHLDSVNDNTDDKIIFNTRRISTNAPQPPVVQTSIAADALWNADTRGRAYAAAASAERHKSTLIWKSFASACVAACVLVLATVLLFGIKTTTAVYHSTIKRHASEAELLQDKADFATNLESVTEREMKPFSMLATANSKRPSDLYYERASASDWNTMRIEGGAQRSELIQGYIEELQKDPSVREVRTLRTATTGGNSTFNIEVVFNKLDDATTGN